MLSFALGLTKTAVERTLSLVKSTVDEEKKLRETVQNDLVFISDEFEMMQSFLRAANNNNNDQVALTCVRQLRNLAFDVEDYVESVIHPDLDGDKSSRWAWLRRLWHMVHCCAPPLPLDAAVAEIKQLKARVEDLSHRNICYNNLLLHGSNNNKQQQPAVTTVVMPPAEQPPDATIYQSSAAFDILRDAWEATGMWHSDNKRYSLQELVVPKNDDDHDLQVISIWGSNIGDGSGGDPGMASIFRRVYLDPRTCEKFKIRAWVKPTHPLNHDEFVKSLLAQFSMSSSHHVVEVTEEDNLMKANKLVEQMREQRYLVVLEDVFTLEEWAMMRMYLPDYKNGSRIVLSTPQLRIALPCARAPCGALELRRFPGDNQFRCAFFKSKTLRNMGEFYRQLQHNGVISVWGPDYDNKKTNLVDILYKGLICGWFAEFKWVSDDDKYMFLTEDDDKDMLTQGIRNKWRKLYGLEFQHHSWVDVPHPFDLKVFAQRLFLNYSGYMYREISKGGKMEEADLIQWCGKLFLFEQKSLVVINGLRSTEAWDLIESKFLSSKANACFILVITTEETVAMHCVKDNKHQAFEVKDLEADTSIASLLSKGSWHYGIRGLKGRLLYDRKKDKEEWTKKFGDVFIDGKEFGNVGGNEGKDEEEFGVFRVANYADVEYSYYSSQGALTHAYYCAFPQIQHRSWVDHVPAAPYFNLTEFAWRLLLDFYSDDIEAKEATAVGLMKGSVKPIEKCREFLSKEKCLVVIHGFLYPAHWNGIKENFLSEPTQSIIIVNNSYMYRRFDTSITNKVMRLGTQQGSTDTYGKEYRSVFYSERCRKALEWTEKFPLVGRGSDESQLTSYLLYEDVHLVSVWGIPGVGKSSLIRTVYYKQMFSSAVPTDWSRGYNHFEAFAWVDVPSPFNLTEFAWRLLLDFYSDDPKAKQTATISMMEEGQVPIQECCDIIKGKICLVVIDGLHSTQRLGFDPSRF